VTESYHRVKSYVDFIDVNASKLVVRAGNRHCGPACSNATFQADLANRIVTWWEAGESSCQAYISSTPTPVPSDISGTFQPIEWIFDRVNGTTAKLKVRADSKAMGIDNDGSVAAYIVSRPRVIAEESELSV